MQAVKVEDLPLSCAHHNTALKFLKELNLSLEDAQQLEILDLLSSLPRKERTKYGKRKLMTEEERNNLTKIRNREHARSTRRRKKIIMEALEFKIKSLQRNLLPLLETKVIERNAELYPLRLQSLMQFFSFRSSHSNRTYDDWVSIASDNIHVSTPTLPPARKDSRKNVCNNVDEHSMLFGIDAVIREAIQFPVQISELLEVEEHDSSLFPCGVEVLFCVDSNDSVAVTDMILCSWTMSVFLNSYNISRCQTLTVTGMGRCQFGFSNALLKTVELKYDVLGFLRQLEGAVGTHFLTRILQDIKPQPLSDDLIRNSPQQRVMMLADPNLPGFCRDSDYTSLSF